LIQLLLPLYHSKTWSIQWSVCNTKSQGCRWVKLHHAIKEVFLLLMYSGQQLLVMVTIWGSSGKGVENICNNHSCSFSRIWKFPLLYTGGNWCKIWAAY